MATVATRAQNSPKPTASNDNLRAPRLGGEWATQPVARYYLNRRNIPLQHDFAERARDVVSGANCP
eukprot:462465-Alexandrium_andersonii.AAC.1